MAHDQPIRYEITVEGALDPDWSDWLNGFDICNVLCPDGTCQTTLTGEIMDQAALRAVINKIWDLNLVLIAVSQRNELSSPVVSETHIK